MKHEKQRTRQFLLDGLAHTKAVIDAAEHVHQVLAEVSDGGPESTIDLESAPKLILKAVKTAQSERKLAREAICQTEEWLTRAHIKLCSLSGTSPAMNWHAAAISQLTWFVDSWEEGGRKLTENTVDQKLSYAMHFDGSRSDVPEFDQLRLRVVNEAYTAAEIWDDSDLADPEYLSASRGVKTPPAVVPPHWIKTSPKALERKLGCSEQTIRRYLESQKIPNFKPTTKSCLVDPDGLARVAEEFEVQNSKIRETNAHENNNTKVKSISRRRKI